MAKQATTSKAPTSKADIDISKSLAKIEKDYGKGSIFQGAPKDMDVEVIPTGSLGLDRALGVSGYPRGRIIEVYGPEASGKTTMTLHAIAEVQKQGGRAAFVDAEHALDPVYATKIGVNMDTLYISQPDSGEEALGIVEDLVDSNGFDIIVVDSVAALVPKAEIEGEMGDAHVGLQARLMSQALRKLTSKVSATKTTLFFINQLRAKIGGFGHGPKETTAGGNALKYYASVRLDVRRIGQIKEGDEHVGSKTQVKVVKNKVSPPFKVCVFELRGRGIERFLELVDHGIAAGLVDKSGAWLEFEGLRGQGRPAFAEALEQDSKRCQALANLLESYYSKMGGITTSAPVSSMDEETGEIFDEE